MKKSFLQRIRLWVQIAFVLFVIYVSIGHYIVANNPGVTLWGVASLHTLCPYGGVVNLYTFFATGNYVSKLHQAVFIMLFALLGLLIFTGASFCGWICPLGSVQEWFGKLGRKIFKTKYNKVPTKIDSVLRYLKYVVLTIIIIQTARTGKLFFEPYDPYYNLFNIWTDEIAITGYISVILTLGLSLFIERPFCRYVCPLGAINGLFNSFSILNIKRRKDTCINCSLCDKACPMGITVSKKASVNSPQCIRCMKCVDACPVNDSDKLTLKIRPIISKPKKSKRSVSNNVYAIIVLTIFMGTILLGSFTGNFITERIKTYETINDIRGSSTLQEIIDHYPVSKEELYRAFNIPRTILTTVKLKDLSKMMNLNEDLEIVSPEGIRLFIEYLNKDLSDFLNHLGKNVATIEEFKNIDNISSMQLRDLVKLTKPGFIAYLISGYWPDQGKITDGAENVNDPTIFATSSKTLEKSDNENNVTEFTLKGKTTLDEIKDHIDNFNDFLQKFNIPQNEPLTTELKDLTNKYGVYMGDMRSYIEDHLK